MVVAQICTEDILMNGGNFEYLTNTTTYDGGKTRTFDLEIMTLTICQLIYPVMLRGNKSSRCFDLPIKMASHQMLH